MSLSFKKTPVIALVLSAAAVAMIATLPRTQGAQPVALIPGTLTLNEGSGVVAMDATGDRLLLEGNESIDLPSAGGPHTSADIQLIYGGATALAQNTAQANSTSLDLSKLAMEDIEDVAWDGSRHAAFLIASHSKTKKNKVKPERYKLARVVFSGDTVTQSIATDTLTPALRTTFPPLAAAMDREKGMLVVRKVPSILRGQRSSPHLRETDELRAASSCWDCVLPPPPRTTVPAPAFDSPPLPSTSTSRACAA